METIFLQKRTLTLFVMCLFSGLIFHYFFYSKTVGISVLLFTLLLYTIFFLQNREVITSQRKLSWFFLLVILLLAATYGIFTNEMFRFFNIVVLPLLFLYHTFLLKKGIPGEWAKPIIIARLGNAIGDMIEIFFKSFSMIGVLAKKRMDEQRYEVGRRVLIGVVISAPILFFVTFLLMSSDVNFSNMMYRIPNWFISLSPLEAIFQIVIVIGITLALFSYFLSLNIKTKLDEYVEEEVTKQPFDVIIVGTVLILINLVYMLYAISQFTYFFNIDPASTTTTYSYATYARKGFAELTVVSLINFTILLVVLHYTSLKGKVSQVLIKGLLTLLVGFSGFMLFSAYHKLSLYEQAYGFTYSRILAHSFMILLFIMLFIAFVRIWSKKIELLKTYVVLAVSYYVILNYLNIDVIIAENNMNWYTQTGKIDSLYMEALSDDVIPYLVELEEKTGYRSEYVQHRKEMLLKGNSSWTEWNWSQHKARQFLKEIE
ncbi:DUF4153 domain-containing protein [Bacillus suaedaesalsae]|uniref:DUF4173 domain-containing protein n=1 Tax=Bacillus suaedaesalsae TaxID=2810349 RepID=A0ABS2DME2_9BACI|nr:DUF4173 domain-containing protein [Bacillus suaedaesalsae]MBM6619576.1 DUF4173 domain-containing protein [Bacillus suaedaesalsae]